MSECYCAVMRIVFLYQYVTVESAHLRNSEDTDASEGTCCYRKNLALCDVSAQFCVRCALQTIEGDVSRNDISLEGTLCYFFRKGSCHDHLIFHRAECQFGGSGISVQIKGNDLNKLRSIGKDIAQIVEDTKGTQNISNGSEETTPDLHVVVDKKKAVKNGLTVATIYQQLSEKLKDASEATTITINEKEYSVNVGNSAKNTLTRDDLKKVKLTGTVSGKEKEVTLDQVANFRNSDSLSSINRNQQERTLSVTSEIKDGYNVGKVSSAVQKKIKKYNAPKGYSITMKGEMESIQETTGQIGLMLLLAVAFMYLIMVAQFQSLKSPFIILFTIPMAFTGGFLGLLITGKDLSAIAMIGFVMLAGIIVNNGIVLVDTINQLRESGYEFEEAILTAGTMRVRPILMTALTTILGLSTMAIGLGQGAEMMQPMAIVTIGGLIYGTLLTLLVVPCIYGLFNRRKKKAE